MPPMFRPIVVSRSAFSRNRASCAYRGQLFPLIAGTAILILVSVGPPDARASGAWRTAPPAPTKRTEVTAAAVGRKIYVLGGFAEPSLGNVLSFAISDLIEEYDTTTEYWQPKSPMPETLHHTAAVSIGERIYVVGGFTKSFMSVWAPVASMYIYDSVSDVWSEGPAMPTARGALAAVSVNGNILAVGGYGETGNVSAVELYDPSTGQWERKAPLPTPRDHLALAVSGDKIYAIGGRRDRNYGRNLSVVEAYEVAQDRWTTVANLPTARSGIAAGVIDGHIYVLGGEAPEGTFNANEVYDPAADQWRTDVPMPTSRHGLASVVVEGELYAIAGGPTPGGSFSKVTEVFRPAGRGRSGAAWPVVRSGRTSSRHVGSVMAVLATLEDAGVLPPENTPEANRLIKALIQFQSAFLKSENQAVRAFFAGAIERRVGVMASEVQSEFQRVGWTSETLEAVVDFGSGEEVWKEVALAQGLREFNVAQGDFELLARTFRSAREKFVVQGKDVHTIYAARRREMPGAQF